MSFYRKPHKDRIRFEVYQNYLLTIKLNKIHTKNTKIIKIKTHTKKKEFYIKEK